MAARSDLALPHMDCSTLFLFSPKYRIVDDEEKAPIAQVDKTSPRKTTILDMKK
jgi:hypothetical protein